VSAAVSVAPRGTFDGMSGGEQYVVNVADGGTCWHSVSDWSRPSVRPVKSRAPKRPIRSDRFLPMPKAMAAGHSYTVRPTVPHIYRALALDLAAIIKFQKN
jgi:hypothetical protein